MRSREFTSRIAKGDNVSIAGPSGCASRPCCRLGLLDSPTDGSYLLNNRPSPSSPRRSGRASATARSCSIFQSFNLIGDLTVFENRRFRHSRTAA